MSVQLIEEAVAAGARREVASSTLGLSARTLERWRGGKVDDERRGPVAEPANKLTPEERKEVLTDVERAIAGVHPDDLPHGLVAGPIAESGRFSEPSSRRRIGEAWLRAREDLGLNLSPEGLLDRALLSVPRHARKP